MLKNKYNNFLPIVIFVYFKIVFPWSICGRIFWDLLKISLNMLTFNEPSNKKHLGYIQLLNCHQISFSKNWKQINESVDTRELCQQNQVLVFLC